MNATLPALLRLVGAPRRRLAAAAALGALTVVFGVGLMATSGYLISRAAERPPILSLMVAVAAVQAFGIARPIARYLERLASHDVALRSLGRVRTRVLRAHRAARAGGARGLPQGRPARAHGRATSTRSRTSTCAACCRRSSRSWPAPSRSAPPPPSCRPRASCSPPACSPAGSPCPRCPAPRGARAGRRQAAARGELSAELVELLGAAPELVAFGGDAAALDRVRAADARLVKLARRDALATGIGDGVGLLVTGVTVAGVLAVAVGASADGQLDRVLIAMLALLALAAFEAVTPLAARPASCPPRSRPAAGCSS